MDHRTNDKSFETSSIGINEFPKQTIQCQEDEIPRKQNTNVESEGLVIELKKVVKNFFDSTTMHGAYSFSASGHWFNASFWAVVFFTCMGMSQP